jgi:adenosine deaminase CECR1
MPGSLDSSESGHHVQKASREIEQALSDTVKPTHQRRLADMLANTFRSSPSEKAGQAENKATLEGDAEENGQHHPGVAKRLKPAAEHTPPIGRVLEVPDRELRELRRIIKNARVSEGVLFEIEEELEEKLASYASEKVKEYDDLRDQSTLYEASLAFDYACTVKATPLEKQANKVLQQLKESDIARFYETAPKKRGYRGQEHPRFYGDHFLSNADLIEKTQLFALCRAMPKGAHLHIHFNANLRPGVLLGIARDMERMFIWSNIPLVGDEAFDLCRIQFSIMNAAAVEEKGEGNPFDSSYQAGSVMQFQQFRKAFPGGPEAADSWLQRKLVFQEDEAHNLLQTQEGLVHLSLSGGTEREITVCNS